MSVLDPQSRQVNSGALRTLQNLFATAANFNINSVRLSINFSKLSPDGSTTLLDTLDTGVATSRGQGDPGYCSDNIGFNSDEQRGALLALTLRARSDSAVFTRDPDIVVTGTIQVRAWDGQYTDLSVEVRQVNNVLHFKWLVTRV
jgi:hypothetical protein